MDDPENPWRHIKGAGPALEFFGEWPSFHDAFLDRLSFDAGDTNSGGTVPPSLEMTFDVTQFGDKDADGRYPVVRSAAVGLLFEGVDSVLVRELTYDNQLYYLTIEEEPGSWLKVVLDSSSNVDSLLIQFRCTAATLLGVAPGRDV